MPASTCGDEPLGDTGRGVRGAPEFVDLTVIADFVP